MKNDGYKLKGDYYTGFTTINNKLDCILIPTETRKEILEDLYEMLLRNQENGKEFNEVIGGDTNSFIDNIIESYSSTLSNKEFTLNLLKNGLLVASLGLVGSIFTNKPSVSAFVYSIIGFIIGAGIYLLFYRVKKSYVNTISSIAALAFGTFNYRAIVLLNEASTFLGTRVSYVLVAAVLAIELIAYFGINKYLKAENKL